MHTNVDVFFDKHGIQPCDILYIIREEKKTSIHLTNGRCVSTYITLKDIYSALPEDAFLRINKSYILPVAQIVSVLGGVYTTKDGRSFVGRVRGRADHNLAAAQILARRNQVSSCPAQRMQCEEGKQTSDLAQYSMESMAQTFYKILKVDLLADRYVIVKDDIHHPDVEQSSTLSGWLTAFAQSGRVHPEDMTDFQRYTQIDYLCDYFRRHSRSSPFWLRYRRKVQDQFRWALMELLPAEDYTDEKPMVYLFIKDIHDTVSASDARLETIFQNLSDEFTAIFYVDFTQNFIMPYRLSPEISELLGRELRSVSNYSFIIKKYVTLSVPQSDQARVLELFDASRLQTAFTQQDTLSYEYSAVSDGVPVSYRVRFSNLSKDKILTHMVVAFARVDTPVSPGRFISRPTLLLLEKGHALADILRDSYEILSAESCSGLIGQAEHAGAVSAVIVDYLDADFTPDEALDTVHSISQLRGVPLLVSARYAQTDDSAQYVTTQASDILYKPYQSRIVRNRVESIVRLHDCTALLERFEIDDLTGLYERKPFIRYASAFVKQNPKEHYSILCSDIEDFHSVNDYLGTGKSDQILRQLANLLRSKLPGCVMGVRLAGDVFGFLLKNPVRTELDATLKVIAEWESAYGFTVRFGITPLENANSTLAACSNARLAIKTIKGIYGRQIAEFDENMHRIALRNRMLISRADQALLSHQFKVYYQPKMNLKDMKLEGAEALVRWLHPDLGMISPSEFIPLFERTGFITQLDTYICSEVCATLAHWREDGLPLVPISLNLSRRDFERDDLVAHLCAMIDRYQISHDLIHFEITESAYSSSPEKVTDTVQQLVHSGFVIELDDFGTGYSSLISLNALELSVLKLDKSLIDQMFTSTGRKILISSITLAKTLHLRTTAEGVEDENQVAALSAMGCDTIQGFYYSRPVQTSDFERFMQA